MSILPQLYTGLPLITCISFPSITTFNNATYPHLLCIVPFFLLFLPTNHICLIIFHYNSFRFFFCFHYYPYNYSNNYLYYCLCNRLFYTILLQYCIMLLIFCLSRGPVINRWDKILCVGCDTHICIWADVVHCNPRWHREYCFMFCVVRDNYY